MLKSAMWAQIYARGDKTYMHNKGKRFLDAKRVHKRGQCLKVSLLGVVESGCIWLQQDVTRSGE